MPHCIHYGVCGGCAVDDRTAINKSQLLRTALQNAGFADAPMAPLVEIPLRSRRRVDLAASRNGAAIKLGLHRARSHEIVDMTECVLLEPQILNLLPPLRVLLRSLEAFRRAGSVMINLLDNGPDILFRTDTDATGPDRNKLIAFASAHGAPRVSIAKAADEPELVAALSPPIITLSGVKVEPPPGAFLQASAAGEAAIIQAVLAGLPKLNAKARIVELYAGIGTLSFALVNHGRVAAYEGAADAATVQDSAIRRNNLAGRMSITTRDLSRRPLKVSEMAGCAAIVLDPPFAGAAAQMKNLTASGAPCIIYVSCNPEALAKDAWLLNRAGYGVVNATPIDQFPYSENLESVVVFSRHAAERGFTKLSPQ
jgi:23S rRNA (uracil1939-C5)-methyltransferase